MSPWILAAHLALHVPSAAADDHPHAQMFAEDGWFPVHERNFDGESLTVHRKHYDGLICARGETLVHGVAAATMVGVAADIPGALDWTRTASLTASEIVAQGPEQMSFFQYLDLPGWALLADRFWILTARHDITPTGEHAFVWWKADDATREVVRAKVLSDHPKAVEVPSITGRWSFRPHEKGVRVRYENCSDIGGSIPKFLQKYAATKTIPDTVADLVAEARRRTATASRPSNPSESRGTN